MTDPKDNIVTLVPKDGITDSNPGISPDGSKIPDAKPSRFALFTTDWLQMQIFVAKALQLPISIGDFDEKYGVFDKKQLVLDTVDAFNDLNASAADFGNPTELLKERQTLIGGEKPASIYGEIVWLANRIAITAGTFSHTYTSLGDILTNAMSVDERREVLTEILTGKGGLRDDAILMEQQANALVQRLSTFAERIGRDQTKINQYASKSSEIYGAARDKLGDLEKEVARTMANVKDANDRYIGFSAGAGGGAALIMVFSFGILWPIAGAVGGGLGVAAELARQEMESFKKLHAQQEIAVQKKMALVTDISSLNDQIGDIHKQVNAVKDGLLAIAGVWNNQVAVLDAIVSETEMESLLTMSAINEKMKIAVATKKWKEIAEATFEFTAYGFVEFREEEAA